MKNFILIIILFSIFSCKNNKSTTTSSVADKQLQQAKCEVKEKRNRAGSEPIIIQTCVLRNYKFVNTGSPDHKGRYSYEYAVYQISNRKDVKVKNSDIFNSNVGKLEKLINSKIAKELKENRKDPETASCLAKVKDPKFSINNMRISFETKNSIEFTVSFGLGEACMNVDEAIAVFPLKEVSAYLK